MDYTVQKLAKLAGISSRTIRYYDSIGLLSPARNSASGYRLYAQAEVDKLQHIMFYRELGVDLNTIKEILDAPSFDAFQALKAHREQLVGKRQQLDLLITNVDKTIAQMEGRFRMNDEEKFEGFKQKVILDNEAKYGDEIRAKYGDKAIDDSNRKIQGMTSEDYRAFTALGNEVQAVLAKAFKAGDPASDLAQKAAELHKQWLCCSWNNYNKEAHANLAQMYVEDERFKAFYDAVQPGTAEFLRDAIYIYTGFERNSC